MRENPFKAATNRWPGDKQFAFTIFDDTDWARVSKVKPVYDFLRDLGMRTTKSVWMFRCDAGLNPGETCEDPDYLNWIYSLQKDGFEVARHNATAGTSDRTTTERSLDRFSELFGSSVVIHANHTGCQENIYWGKNRLSSWRKKIYEKLAGERRSVSRGHVEGDELFWGDLCRQRVRYVRNFVFSECNTLAVCPQMPYYDPTKPFVNYWFAGSDAGSISSFERNFSYRRIDQLIEQRGLCIMYVHFAAGFTRAGRLNPEFRKKLEYMALAGGWFAPVSDVLEYLRQGQSQEQRTISAGDLAALETRWLHDRVVSESIKCIGRLMPARSAGERRE